MKGTIVASALGILSLAAAGGFLGQGVQAAADPRELASGAPAGLRYYTLSPCRLVDTRAAQAPPLAAGSIRQFMVFGGACGVPSTASAISANLTVVTPKAAGYLTVSPGDLAPSATSNLNFGSGQTRANNAFVGLATNGSGTFSVKNGSTAPTDFVLDLNGYFDAAPSYAWRPLRIGAGGWLTGLDLSPDGSTRLVRTDTYGAYIWATGQWRQLVTAASMPAGDVGVEKNAGVYEIRVAPSGASRVYMAYLGFVYRSDDKGAHWMRTAFAPVAMDANDGYRRHGQKMAVDPANPDVVYLGTPASGLFVTLNGGTSWQQVAGIATGTEAGYPGIAFDPTSGTVAGKTKTLYVPSWGNGLWRTSDAGATWTQLTGGPTTVHHGVVSTDGIYYAADGAAVWKYAAGTWTSLLAGRDWHTVLSDPSNPARLIVGDSGATMAQSSDRGATWTDSYFATYPAPGITRVATDIPWLAWANESYMSSGDMAFDPVTHEVVFAEGIGVWKTTFPQAYVGFTWTSQSLGIEQLVANEIAAPPGGKPVLASWDRALFYSASPDAPPTRHGVNNAKSIVMGWGVDYASTDPTFLAAIVDWWGVEQSAYSTDGGQTWSIFPTFPAWTTTPIGGAIAVSTPQNIVWAPSNNQAPYFTKDRGATWGLVTLPGATAGTSFAYYLNRHIVAADRVNAGTFYMYHTPAGLFRSIDGGSTWTLVYAGEIVPFSGNNAKLKSVPGKAGHLFFTVGQQSGSTSGAFMHSTDGGATWIACPKVLEVYAFGFGKAAAGGYPALYIAGWVDNLYGIYRSDDEGHAWTMIADWPLGSLDEVKAVEGDKNVYGTVYVGFAGSGYAYGTIN